MQKKIFFAIIGLLVLLAVYAGIQKSGGIMIPTPGPGVVEDTVLETGTLAGTVSVGPLCPVEKMPPDPGCEPTAETYASYKIFVYQGATLVAQIPVKADGTFSLELAPGMYTLNRAEVPIGSDNLPIDVVIHTQEETTVAITIDTGIR